MGVGRVERQEEYLVSRGRTDQKVGGWGRRTSRRQVGSGTRRERGEEKVSVRRFSSLSDRGDGVEDERSLMTLIQRQGC